MARGCLAYSLPVLPRPLNTLLVAATHVGAFAFAEAVVHEAVAEPYGVLRLC